MEFANSRESRKGNVGHVEFVSEGPEMMESYEQVPLAYETSVRLDLSELREGRFVELPMAPLFKDYDLHEDERPSSLRDRFDLRNWALRSAFHDGMRVAGAIVGFDTPGFDLMEGRTDLAILIDLRVHPDWQGKGIGRELFQHSASRARDHGCTELRVETQDVNVRACRFYHAMGCTLHAIDEHAYPGLDEAQVLWSLKL